MQTVSISPRLLWIAEHVRNDVLFWDVGTDHGKLPVYLVKSGKVKEAIASDVRKEPAERARRNITAQHLDGKIKVCVADGLCGIPMQPPVDIAICGMGGETIVKILSAADFIRCEPVHLLLQPMTDFVLLRKWLAENGFCVTDEDIVLSEGRMYQCLCAVYDGKVRKTGGAEAELGQINLQKRTPALFAYVRHRRRITEKCRCGKLRADADTAEEDELLAAYDAILKEEEYDRP